MSQIVERQKLSRDAIIEMLLIEKDGSSILITQEKNRSDPPLAWNGNTLQLVDFIANGFESRGDDETPRPSIKVSVVEPFMRAFLLDIDFGRGATVTRFKTFLKYMDGQPEADPTQVFQREIYIVSKAIRKHPSVEWEMRSVLEGSNPDFPHLTLARTYCDFIYRRWNSATSSFTPGTCPYDGAPMFDVSDDVTTTQSQDRCSKTLQGCRKRYGNNPLPFRGTAGARR